MTLDDMKDCECGGMLHRMMKAVDFGHDERRQKLARVAVAEKDYERLARLFAEVEIDLDEMLLDLIPEYL